MLQLHCSSTHFVLTALSNALLVHGSIRFILSPLGLFSVSLSLIWLIVSNIFCKWVINYSWLVRLIPFCIIFISFGTTRCFFSWLKMEVVYSSWSYPSARTGCWKKFKKLPCVFIRSNHSFDWQVLSADIANFLCDKGHWLVPKGVKNLFLLTVSNILLMQKLPSVKRYNLWIPFKIKLCLSSTPGVQNKHIITRNI